MSRMAVKAPRMAPNTASQSPALAFCSGLSILLFQRNVAGRGLIGLASRVDRRLGRKSRAQPLDQRVAVVEQDLDRNALHDLGEIAGGVFRRQQSELRARPWRETVDAAVEEMTAICIDGEGHSLSLGHGADLRLLEVGDEIDRLAHRH